MSKYESANFYYNLVIREARSYALAYIKNNITTATICECFDQLKKDCDLPVDCIMDRPMCVMLGAIAQVFQEHNATVCEHHQLG